MPTPDTKERILDAAELLFAEVGLRGFSLRAVTAAAGANIAAVNYHFGSKAALLLALIRRIFAGVQAEQLARLDALEGNAGAPVLVAILDAYAAPIFALFDRRYAGDWGQAWLVAREADNDDRRHHPMNFADTAMTRRYHAALIRALPGVPPDEIWWRFERANNLLMANQGMRAAAPDADPGAVRAERAWLLTFLVGALGAPASATGEER